MIAALPLKPSERVASSEISASRSSSKSTPSALGAAGAFSEFFLSPFRAGADLPASPAFLTDATDAAIEMNEALESYERNAIIAEHSEDLAATEAEKLFKLAEDVDFGDAETFSGKVATIKESYFKKGSANKATAAAEALEEGIVEDDSQSVVEVSDAMAGYLSALRKTTY